MDREAFKQRMQSLKSYREQNPGKGYLDWKTSLPDNLQDESSYNLQRAYELGYEPEYVEEDRSYHLPTRDQETGEIQETLAFYILNDYKKMLNQVITHRP